jgi:dCMP deaminase
MNRPSWDEYFMQMAELASTRSTCLRRKVGAVLVKDKRVISTGYNGAPTKMQECSDVGCLRDSQNIESGTRHEICRAVHSEANAIIQAALNGGASTEGATLYCTLTPCVLCAKMIINAKIKNVVVREYYPDGSAMLLLHKASIPVRQLLQKENTNG